MNCLPKYQRQSGRKFIFHKSRAKISCKYLRPLLSTLQIHCLLNIAFAKNYHLVSVYPWTFAVIFSAVLLSPILILIIKSALISSFESPVVSVPHSILIGYALRTNCNFFFTIGNHIRHFFATIAFVALNHGHR